MSSLDDSWFVYIIRCNDGSLYTGITTNVERRFAEHSSGKGAKYTRGRGPLELLAHVSMQGRSSATRLEAEIKRLPASMKVERLLSYRAD